MSEKVSVIAHLFMTTLNVKNGQATGDYLENIRNINNHDLCKLLLYRLEVVYVMF